MEIHRKPQKKKIRKIIFIQISLLLILSMLHFIKACNFPESKLDINDYSIILKKIDNKRQELKEYHLNEETLIGKKEILNRARETFIYTICNLIAPYWYGTPWDFNGTTEIPGQDGVACGYFVTTLLEHAGYKLDRIGLAQEASENIIKNLISEKYIKRYSNIPINDFITAVKEEGRGLFIIGLDIHTGFILNDGNEVYFIHSSYTGNQCVVKEKAINALSVSTSNYRVLGCLSRDDDFILSWLYN